MSWALAPWPPWRGWRWYGWGWGPWWSYGYLPWAPWAAPRSELEYLESWERALEAQLAAVRARLAMLRGSGSTS